MVPTRKTSPSRLSPLNSFPNTDSSETSPCIVVNMWFCLLFSISVVAALLVILGMYTKGFSFPLQNRAIPAIVEGVALGTPSGLAPAAVDSV